MSSQIDQLAELVRNNRIAELMVFLGGDIDKTNRKGDTALLMATRLNNRMLVNQLINLGADLDKENYRGTTALTLAIFNGFFEIARDLITSGAKVITDKQKEHDTSNLVHTATYKGNMRKLEAILKKS